MNNFIGIDYGSKKAGTTVICHYSDQHLHCHTSQKNKDADKFIKDYVVRHKIKHIYIDAPLSLPNGLVGKGPNYFYRHADKALRAMSPMFLGGLTARAIALRDELAKEGIASYEVYPGGFVREVMGSTSYSKKDKSLIAPFYQRIQNELDLIISTRPTTWHEIDSILCWHIGHRHTEHQAQIIGDIDEGTILL